MSKWFTTASTETDSWKKDGITQQKEQRVSEVIQTGVQILDLI